MNNNSTIPTTENGQMNKMVNAAENALRHVLSLNPEEKMLIVTDKEKESIGRAFEIGARNLGAHAVFYLLPEDDRPLDEIPNELSLMLSGCQVFINAFSAVASETPFRIKLVDKQRSLDARVGHAPGITEDMMIKGPMTVDYAEVADKAKRLLLTFDNAIHVHITTKEGTDIDMDVKDRPFETDAWITAGGVGNLPAGEIWCAPVEDRAKGLVIVNGAIGDLLGGITHPLKITLEEGRITSFVSEDKVLEDRVRELTSIDGMASVIGELGIGLNPKARLTGNLLEDEKAGGTAHIAFGRNTHMPGGKNTSATHRDFLFTNPTFDVKYSDGSRRIVIKDGKVVV